MQFPNTVGPHIGRPNLYQGSSAGKRGSGFTGGSLSAPTKVVRNTLGWQSNYTINYAYVTRRFRNLSDQALNIGQYCFLRKHKQPLGDHRLHTVCNIVQLNDLLLRCAIGGINPEMYSGQNGGYHILNEWTPLGVVATEVGYHPKDESGAEQPQERLINATVMGRVSTFNLWNKDAIVDGCPLWFLLERRLISDVSSQRKRLVLNGELEQRYEDPENRNIQYCWQFRAWGNYEKKFPRAEDASSTIWHSIYIGRVESKGYANPNGSQKHINEAHRDVDRLVTLPKISLFLDYDSKLL